MISVLYVDDEPDLLELCKVFLEQDGDFRVDTTASPLRVFDLLAKNRYDAIVCDYLMPEMDGISVLKEVRGKKSDIPFVLFTGRGREEIVIEALNNGADFYLQKGVDVQAVFVELASKLRQAVLRRHAEGSLKESERKFHDIINFLPDATFAIDRSGTVIAWNRTIEDMTGIMASEMIGRQEYSYAVPFYGKKRPMLIDFILNTDEKPHSSWTEISREKEILTAKIQYTNQNGQKRIMMAKASPLFNHNGEIVGAVESIRDITSLQESEDELRAAHEQLRASEEELRSQLDELTLAEAEIRAREEQLREITATIPGIVFQCSAQSDGNITVTFVSGRSQDILGIPDDPAGFFDRCVAQIHSDDREAFKKSVHDAVQGANPWEYEGRFQRPDGETIWIRGLSNPVRHDTELVYSGVILDITRERERDEVIRRSEQQYRDLAELLPQMVFEMDRELNVTYANHHALDMLGLTRDDVRSGVNALSHILPSEQPRIMQNMEKMLRGEPGGNPEYTAVRNDGSTFPIHIYAAPILRDNTITGFRGVIADISKWKKALSEKRESEARYQSLSEAAQDIIYIIDRNDNIVYLNSFGLSMLGKTAAEVTGKPRRSLFPESTSSHQYMNIQRVISTGKPLRIESTIPLPDQEIWQDTHLVPLRDATGLITGVLGISRDISRLKLAEVALKRSNEKLNLLNSITRHDVANQLTILNGYIQLALTKGPDPVTADFLEKVAVAGETIQRQIEFTRAYQDLGRQAPDWFSLPEVISKAKPDGVTFTSLCMGYEVFADPMLEKVFFNLFDNALRHGERVTSMIVRCETDGEELKVIVEDDGIGIPLDLKQKIFKKGFGKNTGYGLFLVREILGITNISIHETGRHGSGARFEITVPAGGFRKSNPEIPAGV